MTRTQHREELTVTAEENHQGGIKQKGREGGRGAQNQAGHQIRAADCSHSVELEQAGRELSQGLSNGPNLPEPWFSHLKNGGEVTELRT